MRLIDAHVHLSAYGEFTTQALTEIGRLGILTRAVSVDVESYLATRALAAQSELVIGEFGIHPWNASRYAGELDTLIPYLDEAPAIGEIGLDFHWVKDRESYPAQRRVFEFLLHGAVARGKTVNLHTKGAEREIAQYLESAGCRRSIVHWYSGPLELVDRLLAAGAYFTFGVELGRSSHLQAILNLVPDGRLLTETDNPGGQQWLTGELGMPGLVCAVLRQIAALRGLEAGEVAAVVAGNHRRLLGEGVGDGGSGPQRGPQRVV